VGRCIFGLCMGLGRLKAASFKDDQRRKQFWVSFDVLSRLCKLLESTAWGSQGGLIMCRQYARVPEFKRRAGVQDSGSRNLMLIPAGSFGVAKNARNF